MKTLVSLGFVLFVLSRFVGRGFARWVLSALGGALVAIAIGSILLGAMIIHLVFGAIGFVALAVVLSVLFPPRRR